VKIVHVIAGLGVGGAERFLCRLSHGLARTHGVQQWVVSIDPQSASAIEKALADIKGIDVIYLNCRGAWEFPRAVARIRSILRRVSPDIIQSWMYRADFLSALACAGGVPGHKSARLFWNLRCADAVLPIQSRLIAWLCGRMSHTFPARIVACGGRARDVHVASGYDESRMIVINNGYDFPPSLESRRRVAQQRCADEAIIIGAAGRYDPSKDYPNLLTALSIMRQNGKRVWLKIAGRGCTVDNKELMRQIRTLNLTDVVQLLGEVNTMQNFYQSLDIFCLPSVSEGFPNTVCEAMGFGIPVVVTDAGDAREIVGDTGYVVPVSDSLALAGALSKMVEKHFRRAWSKARSRALWH
jgi:glycosyltransferase involved in cell wall biosynthesis